MIYTIYLFFLNNLVKKLDFLEFKFKSSSFAKALNKYNFLSYFGKFYEKGKVPETLQPSLTEEEIMKKNNTLEIYKAEMKSIDAFWRQMVPFEYWKKASVLKKD